MKPNRELIDLRIYSEFTFSSEAKIIQWQEGSLSNKYAATTKYSHRKKRTSAFTSNHIKKIMQNGLYLNIKVKNKV